MSNTIFNISQSKFGKQASLTLRNNNTNEFVTILPETGAMILNLSLQVDNKLTSLLDTYADEKELNNTLTSSFKGSFLFPFPNRIDAGTYSVENHKHQLDINFPDENNAIHGLVFDKPFNITNEQSTATEASVELSFKADGSLTGYPYKFEVTVTYTLNKDGLSIKSTAKNIDTCTIPVGFGWHPYFALGDTVTKIDVSFPSTHSFDVDERMLPTTKQAYTDFNTHRNLGNTSFDTCFAFEPAAGKAETKITLNESGKGISVWQEKGAEGNNFVQIYTPGHRKSIAIEPMTCIANAFNNEIGLILLKPGQTTSNFWGVAKI